MRIRKAEKLLGFASEYDGALSPAAEWDSAAAIVAAAGLLCEINRSSCADVSISLHSSNHQEEELEIANEEQHEIDIAGKRSADKEDEVSPEEKVADKEEIMNEKEPSRRRREKEAEATGTAKCKKMNGEGWHGNVYQLSSGDDKGGIFSRKNSAAVAEAGDGTDANCCGLGMGSRESGGGGNESWELDEEFGREAVADEEGMDGGNLCNYNYKKKMKPVKKRGRKPMKARSLKSLLSFKVC